MAIIFGRCRTSGHLELRKHEVDLEPMTTSIFSCLMVPGPRCGSMLKASGVSFRGRAPGAARQGQTRGCRKLIKNRTCLISQHLGIFTPGSPLAATILITRFGQRRV